MTNASNVVSAECRLCGARTEGVCASVPAGEAARFGGYQIGVRNLAVGSDLFRQGDEAEFFFILHHGWTFTYVLLADGRRQILGFWLPGTVHGFLPPRTVRQPFSCQALTDIAVCVIPRTLLSRIVRDQPEFGLSLAASTARDGILVGDHLASVGRRSARERVAHLLFELFCRSRGRLPTTDDGKAVLPLTQSLIADAMGLTSIHVSRTLSRLRLDRVVAFHGRALRIIDAKRLAAIAGIEAEVAEQWVQGLPESETAPLPALRGARR